MDGKPKWALDTEIAKWTKKKIAITCIYFNTTIDCILPYVIFALVCNKYTWILNSGASENMKWLWMSYCSPINFNKLILFNIVCLEFICGLQFLP